ncbi:MAG TPA: L,D-transpeptidase family protein [Polyangiaceae bacterium]|jgi:L,D-peptidoglycan transpeptidase YkuD (ErfK/YbiS/YcfS/YnhG family)|nr:L,D-transpeptidase family protein [Polyangiaceae bacterium]
MTPTVLGNQADSSPERRSPIPKGCEQLLVVRSEGWTTTSATLQRYAREKDADWQAVGDAIHVNVGRHGMAWGRGLHDSQPGPAKLEGDGRTPAGVFPVGALFGYAEQPPADADTAMPYIHFHVGTECVEDPRSPLYNRIVDTAPGSPLIRADGVFRLGFVIDQNAPDTVAGAGSCVFFHVQRGPSQATSGCTSASFADVQALVGWLDARARPVVVELPEGEYTRLKNDWGLP